MNKKLAFLLYSWGTTSLFIAIIFWLSTVPYLADSNDIYEQSIKTLYRITLYGVLFLLVYRSLLATFRTTVKRLSKWHSKAEKADDTEFVLIIETLLVVIAITISSLIAVVDEFIQIYVDGRFPDPVDILISIMAILLAAILVYSTPSIGELEIALKHKFFDNFFKKRGIK
ncbi:VanZ family protein [Candidatus Dojkabacteria bacterium]|uniref:VanZ family protein n=1 Tax=Candidatus Dojkabacteria bacterium TaxID=2099670 RepID=A0A955RLF8_9BACT|nr:VanZ family protein [Candidatus Dojkabacteria bacterium]